MARTLAVIVLICIAFSCKKSKSDGIDPADKEKAAQLRIFLESKSFQLKKYYSETPIDYVDTDQVVKAETDLWPYVSEWLHDDEYIFNTNGTVTIRQNAKKIDYSNSETITKNFSVEADQNGVGIDFIGHEYHYLAYRLLSFNDTVVKVSATWHGKEVISEYQLIP